MTLACAAVSSIASGRPSRRRQTSATSAAFSDASEKSECCAGSINEEADSVHLTELAEGEIVGRHSASGATGKIRSAERRRVSYS